MSLFSDIIGMAGGGSSGFLGNLFVRLNADSANLVRGMRQAEMAMDTGVHKMMQQLKLLSAAATSAFAIVGAAGVKAAADFESSFAGVRKTVDATEGEFRQLAATFRQMARQMPTDVNDINRIAESAGQLGVQKENLKDFTKTIIELGVATNLKGEEAATTLARFANVAGVSQKEFSNVAAALVALGNDGASTEREIMDMALRIASAGRTVGMTAPEILAMANALSSVGLEAEMGGTAISNTMIMMNKAVKSGGMELALFANVAGMTADQFQKAFGEDAASTVMHFARGLQTLKDRGFDIFTLLEQLGIEGIRQIDTVNRMAGAHDLFQKSLDLGTKSYKDNTAHVIEAEKRFATFASQIQVSWNIIKDIAITIGDGLIPVLRTLNTMFQDSTKDQESFQRASQEIADTFSGPFLFAVGLVGDAINGWRMILKGVQMFFLDVVTTIWGEINRITEGSIQRVNALIGALNKIRPILQPASMLLPGGGKIPEVNMTPSEIMAGLHQQREDTANELAALAGKGRFSDNLRAEYEKTVKDIKNLSDTTKKEIEATYTPSELGLLVANRSATQLQEQVMATQQLLRDFNNIPFLSMRGSKAFPGAGMQGFDSTTMEAMGVHREIEEAQNALKIMEEIDKQRIQLDAETLQKKEEMQEAYLAKLQKLHQAETQIVLGSAISIGDSLVDIAKNLQGEQSGIYKAMFAASKAFAIADSIVKIQQGIANAAILPWPANLAAIASTVAATANIISSIQSVKLAFDGERAAGGMVKAGRTYLVGERGPESFVPASNGTIIPNDKLAGEVKVVVNNYTDAHAEVRERQEGGTKVLDITIKRVKEEIASEIRDGRGSVTRAIEGSYGVRRGRV